MKKLSKFSFLFIILSFILGNTAFAATPTIKATPIKGVLSATVNIEKATIVSQKDNIFNISFSLSNREGLQTGVKYSVKLVKKVDDNQFILDEKVYEESLTLNPNTTTNKEIVYTAPSSLSGSYNLSISSNNSSGFPFGTFNLGKVNLVSTSSYIEILPETCTLSGSNNKSYNLIQGIIIKPEESIKLTCSAINSSKEDLSVTPTYETHYRSSFGQTVDQNGGDNTPVSFKTGEKKTFSVVLPKVTIPQLYNVTFTLGDKDHRSNPVSINYAVFGDSATIENVSLDKDFYMKGESALVSFVYKSNSLSPLTSNITISSGKGKSCVEPFSKNLEGSLSPKIDSTILIESKCVNPVISLSLTDQNGKVLDQKEWKVNTTSKVPGSENTQMIIIIIVLVILLIAIIYVKRKNTPTVIPPTNSIPMSVVFPFLLMLALFGFVPTGVVLADTYSYADPGGRVAGNFTFDKSYYVPSGSVAVSNSVDISTIYGAGDANTNILMETSINSQLKSRFLAKGTPVSMYTNGVYYFTAPSYDDLNNAFLGISYIDGSGTDRSFAFTFYYATVTPPTPGVTVWAVDGGGNSVTTIPEVGSVTPYWRTNGSDLVSCKCEYVDKNYDIKNCNLSGETTGYEVKGLRVPATDFKPSTSFVVTCSTGANPPNYSPNPTTTLFYYPTCFTSDTLVTLSDGQKVNIQDVRVGDVLKGETTDNKVLGLHRPELNGNLYSINGGRYFVTEEHPFKTTQGWKSINPKKTLIENIGIEVTELKVGDTLVTEKGPVLIKTLDGKTGEKGTDLFNFILDGDHTYYADGYLVHNKQLCTLPDGTVSCGPNNFCVDSDGFSSPTGSVCPLPCSGSTSYSGCASGYKATCSGTAIQCVPLD